MYYIESKYGNDGYAFRYKMLEELGQADHHFIDFNKEENVLYMSAKCRLNVDIMYTLTQDLATLGVFDKEIRETYKVIRSNKFILSIQDAYLRRKNDCITREWLIKHIKSKCIHKPSKCIHKPSKWWHKPNKCIHNDNINTQRIGKDTIGKDSKEKKTTNTKNNDKSLDVQRTSIEPTDDFIIPTTQTKPEKKIYWNPEVAFVVQTLLDNNGWILSDTKAKQWQFWKHLVNKLEQSYWTDWKETFTNAVVKISGDPFIWPFLWSVEETYRKIWKIMSTANIKHREMTYPLEMDLEALNFVDGLNRSLRTEVITVMRKKKEQGINHLSIVEVKRIVNLIKETKWNKTDWTWQTKPVSYNSEELESKKSSLMKQMT